MGFDYTAIDALAPLIVVIASIGTAAWIFNNWLRMRHGYPLENSSGKVLYPMGEAEGQARVQMLTQENAQLRAEIGSLKDRVASVEPIVTDQGYDIARQIEGLRATRKEVVTQ